VIDDQVFRVGLHALAVAFNREMSEDLRDVYREALGGMSNDQFRGAVREVILAERFFPPPALLLGYGREVARSLALPEPPRTEEDREAGRLAARAGLEAVKARYQEAAAKLPPAPIVTPPPPELVVASDERMDELQRQKAAILAEKNVAPEGAEGTR